MGWFITAIILAVIGVIAILIATKNTKTIQKAEVANRDRDSYSKIDIGDLKVGRLVFRITGVVTLALAALFAIFSVVYFQNIGEAKVLVNADGTVAGTDLDAGVGFKAPWQNSVDFDLFSQEVLYAGGNDGAPSYSGGEVQGKEVSVSVGGINGGSTQAQVDLSVVYSVSPNSVLDIYKDWRSQERFTKSIVEKTILSVTRQVPSSYSIIEFRGEKRAEAASKIEAGILDKLKAKGIEDVIVNIQDVRVSETVQAALNDVENANQAAQKAEAEQRRIKVEAESAKIKAEGEAQAAIAKAQGEAEANRLLTQSLTPEVLQQRLIDAYKEGTVFVTDGNSPLLLTPPAATK